MPPPEELDLITLFVAPLNRLGVTYMVTGSVAAGMYGEPRLTNDIDLVIALERAEIPRLHDAFDESSFYVPPAEVMRQEQSREQYGHFNLIHHATAFKADIYLAAGNALERWALDRRESIVVGPETVHIAPPEYVIISKLQYFKEAGSTRHLRDIRRMVDVLGDRLRRGELMRWIGALDLEPQWAVVQSTAHER